MPKNYRFRCQFRCAACGAKIEKLGSCRPPVCACGAPREAWECTQKIDLKK